MLLISNPAPMPDLCPTVQTKVVIQKFQSAHLAAAVQADSDGGQADRAAARVYQHALAGAQPTAHD